MPSYGHYQDDHKSTAAGKHQILDRVRDGSEESVLPVPAIADNFAVVRMIRRSALCIIVSLLIHPGYIETPKQSHICIQEGKAQRSSQPIRHYEKETPELGENLQAY